MKKTISLSLATMAGITMLLSSCSDPKKEEVLTPPQNPNQCTSSLDPNAESDIDSLQVEFSFVFMGCNRVDTNSLSNASTANLFQLQRTFNEVSAMTIKPKFFFFLGDLVLGLDTEGDTLKHQLNAWVTQFQSNTFSSMPNSGIRLVALPGNHEMLYAPSKQIKATHSNTLTPRKPELPLEKAAAIWRNIMQPFSIQIGDDYGISYAPADSITYSFNYKGTHFVLLNTDMYDPKNPFTPGLAPASWICNDITAAKNTGKINHMFVMGHKPSYILLNATRAEEAIQDEIMDTTVTDQIWPVMESNNVEAMLSAHRHEYSVLQPNPSKTYQIIAGNGGSKYESHLPINNQFFGFTKIYIMKNGEVIARSFGRLTPKKTYTDPLPCDTLTRIRYNQPITWNTHSTWFNPMDSIQQLFDKKSKK